MTKAKSMLKKSLISTIKNVHKFLFILVLIIPTLAESKEKQIWPFDKTKITMKDGRTIRLDKMSEEYTWKLSLFSKAKKLLWSKTYSQDFKSLWGDAFFVRVKRKTFIYDLNHDGYPEIALTTWDGGNAPLRPAIIFTVKEKELKVFRVIDEYLFESGEPLYK